MDKHIPNAWGKYVTGILDFEDPIQKVHAEQFNQAFYRVFKSLSMTDRQVLMKMVHALSTLYSNDVYTNWINGRDWGYRWALESIHKDMEARIKIMVRQTEA